MTTAIDPERQTATSEIFFGVQGMTCASCVRRVEKALAKVDGVAQASVNLATEKARVSFDPEVASFAQLKTAVEHAGYGIEEIPAEQTAPMPAASKPVPSELDLAIEGMTCASCVRRVEKALNRVEGVTSASVNLATEKAHVSFDPMKVDLPRLEAAVSGAGYAVGVMAPAAAPSTPAVNSMPLRPQRRRSIRASGNACASSTI